MSSIQIRRGAIVWQQDLNGSAASTVYPSGASAGVGMPSDASAGRVGDRVHVRLRYQVASGTLSTDCHLYGYGASATVADWTYLGSLNAGASIVSTDVKHVLDSSTAVYQEVFTIAHSNMERFATRIINPQGTTPLVSTWVGYERG